MKKQNDELKKKISSVKDQIKQKDEASVELLSIIDLLHDLNGMENAGEDLLSMLRKLEIDLFDFNKDLDDV